MMRFVLALLILNTSVFAQNLMEERIWKVSPRKKSIFLDAGVFHHSTGAMGASITGIRSSANSGQGYERVVIDFNTNTIPRLYGHINSQNISVDFFDSKIATSQPKLKNSKNVKNIDFINVDGKSITMDLSMKGKTSFDIFYLENPGRLVIDIR